MKEIKLFFLFYLFFLTNTTVYGQNHIDSTLLYLKKHDFAEAQSFALRINNNDIKELCLNQINYYITGNLDSNLLSNTKSDRRSKIIKNLLLGDYYYLKKDATKNNFVFEKYFNAIKASRALKDTFLISEGLRRLNFHILYRARDTLASKRYIEMYQELSYISRLDFFWYNFLSIGYEFMMTEKAVETANKIGIEMSLEKLFLIANEESFLEGQAYQIKGIYLSHWIENYNEANICNLKARDIYSNIPIWYAQSKITGLEYNTHINYFKVGKYKKAISFFRKDLYRNKELLYKMYTNEWLFKCYEGLKKYDSAHYYFKQMAYIKEEMKQSENAVKIQNFNTKYNFQEKERELAELAQEKHTLQNSLFTLIPILGTVTLILIFIFYLYKRYKNKSGVLEKEKSQTLQKLDELKSIVIKNHIVLKDKTKVYISDLMYIKSDDHYLVIYMSDGKNHFVRGKLSQIKEELPPNFIQCHRSYIVNSNYIKQINKDSLLLINKDSVPLSRSYKDKF